MPQADRGEHFPRLEMEVEAWPVDVAAGVVAKVEPDVDLVGALVLGEPHVPVDAEQRPADRTVSATKCGPILRRYGGEAPDELQGRLLDGIEVPLLVLGEPGPVVVLAQVLQEPEQIRGEQSLAHGSRTAYWVPSAWRRR